MSWTEKEIKLGWLKTLYRWIKGLFLVASVYYGWGICILLRFPKTSYNELAKFSVPFTLLTVFLWKRISKKFNL